MKKKKVHALVKFVVFRFSIAFFFDKDRELCYLNETFASFCGK